MTTKLNIYLTQINTQKVGILAQKNGKIYFEYDMQKTSHLSWMRKANGDFHLYMMLPF